MSRLTALWMFTGGFGIATRYSSGSKSPIRNAPTVCYGWGSRPTWTGSAPIRDSIICCAGSAGSRRRGAAAQVAAGLFTAMNGYPVVIRTLDPPLHEFLPKREDLMVDVARLPYADIKKLSLIHISEPTRLGMISYA